MRFAFTLHLVIETPASVNFMLRPSSTLSTPQVHSHGVIRQYALLLAATNCIVALLISHAIYDDFAGQIAGALALYHLGPLSRAVSRIRHNHTGDALGGPWVHMLAHAFCAVALIASFALNSI